MRTYAKNTYEIDDMKIISYKVHETEMSVMWRQLKLLVWILFVFLVLNEFTGLFR